MKFKNREQKKWPTIDHSPTPLPTIKILLLEHPNVNLRQL